MALFPMEQLTGASGSGITERVLWTNASPTAAFGNATVSIADYISNYDFIKVYFGISKTTPTTMSSVVIPVDEFKTMTNQASSVGDFTRGASSISRVSSTYRTRSFYYVSETQIGFYAASNLAATGSSNDYAIPIKISGLKASSWGTTLPSQFYIAANFYRESDNRTGTYTLGTSFQFTSAAATGTLLFEARNATQVTIIGNTPTIHGYRLKNGTWEQLTNTSRTMEFGSDCDLIFLGITNSTGGYTTYTITIS